MLEITLTINDKSRGSKANKSHGCHGKISMSEADVGRDILQERHQINKILLIFDSANER